MSLRSYTGPTPRRRRRRLPRATTVPWVLTGATVLAQIAYPLVEGDARAHLTQVTVALFFLASTTHALVRRGVVWTLGFLVVTLGVGLAVEVVGVGHGFPFGGYEYAGSLGPAVNGVPLVIPFAWAMMAYPALLVAQTLCRGRVTTPLVGAVALTSWDVFLDPQMVAEGHWRFTDPEPSPPLLDGIPWTNFGGWFLVALVMMVLLDRLPRRRTAGDGAPAVLYLWTYASSILANLSFFDRPEVALAGGVVMGSVALPFAYRLWAGRP